MLAHSKLVRGNRTTGVVGVACRHELWRPTCMTPTQKGERLDKPPTYFLCTSSHNCRQVNGDWSFMSTLKNVSTLVCHSYDINCQWSIHVSDRLRSYPKDMQLSLTAEDVTFKIPKLHMQAHQPKCHPKYSLNYSLNVAQWDGEGIERRWSATNEAAGSAAEMSPGAHQEFLDDVLGFQNHKKVLNLGEIF
jgi:hypothetical protein